MNAISNLTLMFIVIGRTR